MLVHSPTGRTAAMSESLSMYQACIPVLDRALRNLAHILEKGEAHARAQGYDPSVLLQARLYPDMLPLLRQVQIATDTAKFAPARLAGVESPRFEDSETSFAELHARLERAREFLATFVPEQIDGSEEREVVLQRRSGEQRFSGRDYLLGFVVPNLLFHVGTAYAILRHNGVPLGKTDYLGGA